MHAAISPYGVIDFADNHTLQTPGGVIGGPPAYLEAHGIRYVPMADGDNLEPASLGCEYADDPRLVSMGRDAAPPETSYVSPAELNSRVDNRIRKFMSDRKATAGGVHSMYRDDLGLRSLRASLDDRARASSRSGLRLDASLSDEEDLLIPRRRALADDAGSTHRKIAELRRECEAAASKSMSNYEPAASKSMSTHEDAEVHKRLAALERECEVAEQRARSRSLAQKIPSTGRSRPGMRFDF